MADNTTYTLTPTDGNNGDGNRRVSIGQVVFGATAIVAADSTRIVTGFRPRRVRWVNLTDRIEGEWFEGMADNGCLKTVAAGTRTFEVTGGNGGITVDDKGFRVLQNATLALVLASKTCYFIAEG